MSDIRSDPYTLKDPDDNDAFSVLKDDVRLVKQQLLLGTPKIPSTAGLSSSIDALTTRLTTDEAAITALQASVSGITSAVSPVAFQAYVTGTSQTIDFNGSGATVVFNNERFSQSAYNTGTGFYSAPATGTYLFAYTLTVTFNAAAFNVAGHKTFQAWLAKGATTMAVSENDFYWASATVVSMTLSGTAVVSMTSGDTISVLATYAGALGANVNVRAGSDFTGFRIS